MTKECGGGMIMETMTGNSELLPDPAQSAEPIHLLAHLGGARPPAPDWYKKAMAVAVETRRVMLEGAGVEVLCWGVFGRPAILLVHGMSAHAGWWGPVAPLLSLNYRVISLSFTGMGGSDWRLSYSVAQMSREVLAAAEIGGAFAGDVPPMVVAHSFGGRPVSRLAAEQGALFAGAVFIDSLLRAEPNYPPPNRTPRSYHSEAEALSRFRFAPPQGAEHLYIVDDLARASLRQSGAEWRWAFDPDFHSRLDLSGSSGWLPQAKCPVAFIRGARSRTVSPREFTRLHEHLPPGSVRIEIAEAGHHVMVDQPIAVVAALRIFAAGWMQTPLDLPPQSNIG